MTTLPLLLCCLWVIAANIAGMLPSRRGHWPAAIALVATGIPLLGLVTWQYGPIAGLVAFGAGASILRWPIRLGLARMRRRRGIRPQADNQRAQPAE
jgi:Protein of unknown function (DUF2484)